MLAWLPCVCLLGLFARAPDFTQPHEGVYSGARPSAESTTILFATTLLVRGWNHFSGDGWGDIFGSIKVSTPSTGFPLASSSSHLTMLL
eukprot:9501338-Pyramimonas_sp.AAC.1